MRAAGAWPVFTIYLNSRSDKGAMRIAPKLVPIRSAGKRSSAECDVDCIDPRKVESAARRRRPDPDVLKVADTLRALGDPTRLRLVDALSHHELCVCDLAAIVGASQSAVSHSLRILRELRIVRYRREGKIAYYSLDDSHVRGLLAIAFSHAAEV